MIFSFLKHDHLLRKLNKTNITLIPKKKYSKGLIIDQLVYVMSSVNYFPNFSNEIIPGFA